MTARIAVDGLSCRRGGLPILEGISFTLGPGEALVLRGPNGAGKTTLLRTLAGLQPQGSGRVDISPPGAAYAGHADGIKPTLTARENLAFWASIFGEGDPGAGLGTMGLARLAERPAGRLSAGQARRLGLARLLLADWAVWLLDEPTVSLDTDGVKLFADIARRHLNGGGALIAATHLDLGLNVRTLDVARHRADPATALIDAPA